MKNQNLGFWNGEEDNVLFTSSLGFESSSLLGGGGYETEIVHIKEDTDESGDMGGGEERGHKYLNRGTRKSSRRVWTRSPTLINTDKGTRKSSRRH